MAKKERKERVKEALASGRFRLIQGRKGRTVPKGSADPYGIISRWQKEFPPGTEVDKKNIRDHSRAIEESRRESIEEIARTIRPEKEADAYEDQEGRPQEEGSLEERLILSNAALELFSRERFIQAERLPSEGRAEARRSFTKEEIVSYRAGIKKAFEEAQAEVEEAQAEARKVSYETYVEWAKEWANKRSQEAEDFLKRAQEADEEEA